MNYYTIAETASYIYFSIHSKFWALGAELYSVYGAYNFWCMRYFFRAACHPGDPPGQTPKSLKRIR